MLNKPPDLLGRFVAVLEERGVALLAKTLRYYSHWARKLHDFRKAREPSSLSSEEVKDTFFRRISGRSGMWCCHARTWIRSPGIFIRPMTWSPKCFTAFASHLLQANYDIRTIQKLLGHSDVRTTMIYTHTIKSRTLKEAKSPLDF